MKMVYLIILLMIGMSGFSFSAMHMLSSPLATSAIEPSENQEMPLDRTQENASLENSSVRDINYSATISRPLFNRDRKKFVKPPPPKPALRKPVVSVKPQVRTTIPVREKQPDPVFTLLGVSITDDKAMALLSEPGSQNVWVSTGDKVKTWNVEAIGQNNVRLSKNSREISLFLYAERPQ